MNAERRRITEERNDAARHMGAAQSEAAELAAERARKAAEEHKRQLTEEQQLYEVGRASACLLLLLS